MATEKIEGVFDVGAIHRQASEVVKKIGEVTEAMEVSAARIAACNERIAASGGYRELTKATGEFVRVNRECLAQTKELILLQLEQAAVEQKFQQACLETVKRMGQVRQEVAEEAKAVRELVKAQQEKEKADQVTLRSAGEMIVQLRRQKEVVASLNAETRHLQEVMKSMDYRSQGNVIGELNGIIETNTLLAGLNADAYVKQAVDFGRYQSAVSGLCSVLKSLQGQMQGVVSAGGDGSGELARLGETLKEARTGMEEYAAELAALAGDSNGLKAELSGVQGQMEQMALAGELGTEQYWQLGEQAGALTQRIGELDERMKGLEAPVGMFEAVQGGLSGLAGGFQAARGVLGMFNVESEAFGEIQSKVQSAIVITNGLVAVRAALDEKSALMTGLSTAAQSGNIVVSKAAAVAQRVLNAAISANPVMLLVTALIAGTVALAGWMASARGGAAEQVRQNEVHDKAIDSYAREKTEIESLAGKIQSNSASREEQARMVEILTEKYGDNYSAGKSMQEMEQDFVDNAPAFVEAARNRAEAQAAFELAVGAQKKALEATTKGVEDYVGWWGRLFRTEEQEIALADKRRDEEIAAQNEVAGNFLKIQAQKIQGEKEAMAVSGEVAKEENKEREKSLQARLKLSQLGVRADIDAQTEILNNTKSSCREKLAALETLTAKQIAAVEMQRDAELSKTANKDERALLYKKAEADIRKIQRESAREKEKLGEKEAENLRQVEDLRVQATMDASQKILDSEKSTYAERVAAQVTLEAAEKKMAEKRAEAQVAGLEAGSSEAMLIQERLQAELTGIEERGQKDRAGIEDAETARRVKGITDNLELKKSGLEEEYENEQNALAEKYSKGFMSQEMYQQKKLNLSRTYAKETFDAEIKSLQDIVDNSGLQGEDLLKAQKALADKKLEYKKWNNEQERASDEELAAAKQQLMQASYDAIFSLMGSMFDRKIQQVEEEMEKVDEQKEHDLEALDEMDISDEERVARKEEIEAKAEADKEKLEKKKKKLQQEKAKMDKAAALIKVAIDTAVGVAAAWSNPFAAPALIPIIIATGAIQAAVIAAQPLPKYARGTEDHAGGWAVVGDGGRKELVRTPEGDFFVTPDNPTLVNLPKHSEVFPDLRVALKSLSFAPVVRDDIPYDARMEQRLEALERAIKETTAAVVRNRPQMNIQLDRQGVWNSYECRKGRTKYINERLNINR